MIIAIIDNNNSYNIAPCARPSEKGSGRQVNLPRPQHLYQYVYIYIYIYIWQIPQTSVN